MSSHDRKHFTPVSTPSQDAEHAALREKALEEIQQTYGIPRDQAERVTAGEEPMPGTLGVALLECNKHGSALALEIFYALRLDRLADWMTRQIRRMT